MEKHVLNSIKKIVENEGTNNVIIITSHLKIEGKILIPEGKCEECCENYIALKDVEVCQLEDYCNCNEDGCHCNDANCCNHDWLNINIDKIVAFSVTK